MIKFIERYFKQTDNRGTIEGVINWGDWKEVNLITSIAGSTRGDHYHKETTEFFFILEGKINIELQKVKDEMLAGEAVKIVVKAGDVFLIEPYINHIFFVKDKSRWFNFLSKPIDKNNPDIFKSLHK